MKSALPAQKDGPRINEEIRSKEVQLIDSTGDNKGVVDFQTAMSMAEAAGLDLVEISPKSSPAASAMLMAEAAGLDLVEISPNTNPPVCKILDFGKYKF